MGWMYASMIMLQSKDFSTVKFMGFDLVAWAALIGLLIVILGIALKFGKAIFGWCVKAFKSLTKKTSNHRRTLVHRIIWPGRRNR